MPGEDYPYSFEIPEASYKNLSAEQPYYFGTELFYEINSNTIGVIGKIFSIGKDQVILTDIWYYERSNP